MDFHCKIDCNKAPQNYVYTYIASIVYSYYKWATEELRCWKLKTACTSASSLYSSSSDVSTCSAEIVPRSHRSAEKWICYHEHTLLSQVGRSPSTTWPACVIQECQLSFPQQGSLVLLIHVLIQCCHFFLLSNFGGHQVCFCIFFGSAFHFNISLNVNYNK